MLGTAELGQHDAQLGSIILGYIPPDYIEQELATNDLWDITDRLASSIIDSVFTDVARFFDRFEIALSFVPDFDDRIFFQDSFHLAGRYTIIFNDKIQFSEGNFSYRVDNTFVNVPSFIISKAASYMTLSSPFGIVVLDPPIFNDAEAPMSTVSLFTAISGFRYSHVKTMRRRQLKYELQFRKKKCNELKRFLDQSNLYWMTLSNWKSETWTVQLTNNPIEITAIDREFYSVTLEFQGYRLGGDLHCSE